MQRYHFLDGLRGLFSVIVLLFHVFFVVYAPWLPSPTNFGLLFDGNFAVNAFFVLSGMALSIGYLTALEQGRSDAEGIIRRMAAGRFVRLALPSLAACLLMYLIMKLGWNFYPHLPAEFRTDWWNYAYGKEDIRLFAVVKFALYDVFVPREFIPILPYSGPYVITNLWTMSVEFVGSIFIFMLLFCFKDGKMRCLFAGIFAVALAFSGSYFAFFFAGVVATDLYLKFGRTKHPTWLQFAASAVVAVLFFYGQPAEFYQRVLFGFSFITIFVICAPLQWLMGSLIFRWLGKLSFALYLVHIPVLVSVQSYLTLVFLNHWDHWQIMAVAGGTSVVLSFAAAWVFRYVDRWSVSASHWVANLLAPKAITLNAASAE